MDNPKNSFAALSDAMAEAVTTASASIVTVEGRRRFPATGIVWDSNGLIITSNHAVERDEDITVRLPDGTEVAATLVGRDPSTDLALLKVEASDLTPATWATDEVKTGNLVLAVGRAGNSAPTASLGIISGVAESSPRPGPRHRPHGRPRGRRGHPRRRPGGIAGAIHADVTMYPGFSGGPLINAMGEVIGLNTSGWGGPRRRPMPLTIPYETIERVATTLAEKGRIPRGYIGVAMQPVQLPESAGQPAGLLIVGVEEGSPAAEAGLLIGDTLLSLGDTQLSDPHDLHELLSPDQIGQQVQASVLRAGQTQQITLTVGER